MNFDEAMSANVSRDEAISELAAHYVTADYEGSELFDCVTGETIAMADADGLYRGADVLAYLGY